jgi:hypothetical protein
VSPVLHEQDYKQRPPQHSKSLCPAMNDGIPTVIYASSQ